MFELYDILENVCGRINYFDDEVKPLRGYSIENIEFMMDQFHDLTDMQGIEILTPFMEYLLKKKVRFTEDGKEIKLRLIVRYQNMNYGVPVILNYYDKTESYSMSVDDIIELKTESNS